MSTRSRAYTSSLSSRTAAMKQTMTDDAAIRRLLKAIASAHRPAVLGLLTMFPALASAALKEGAKRGTAPNDLLTEINHYVYAGDTALHVAAAAHRPEIARELISRGADVAARNRRGAAPLHYAADGIPGSPHWDPVAQSETVALLIASGADPNAIDQSGVTPLHRAVRTRCAAAANTLIARDAYQERRGSTNDACDAADCAAAAGLQRRRCGQRSVTIGAPRMTP